MSIEINKYFEIPSESSWREAAIKSLKFSDENQLNNFLEHLSLEQLVYRPTEAKGQETYLNTYPTNRILGREILVGQPHLETMDVGIDYIFSSQLVAVHEKQKLIQLIKDKNANFFGDEILIDVFSLLQQFEYSHQDLLNYLDKSVSAKNIHLLVNISPIHNAGADIITELAHGVFLGLKYADLFFARGCKVCFKLPVDSQFFTQIAKLRALRYLFETILEKQQVNSNQFLIWATNSLREMSLFDPWVNMLRGTSSVTSSFLGGADIIVPRSFDVLNQIYNMQASSTLALRQSRNTFHILKEESHLSFVNDPVRGSYAVEDLTQQIIQKTFIKLKELNGQKSMKFLYEKISEQVQHKANERYEKVQTRHKILCGINNFSNVDEKLATHFNEKNLLQGKDDLFPLRRLPSEFELLRIKCEKSLNKNPKGILILHFGDLKKINARMSFCSNYFEILGLQIETQDIHDFMTLDPQKYLGVVYCALDDEYSQMFELIDTFPETNLFIAGKKISKPGFTNLFLGQNVYSILEDFVEKVSEK